MREKLETDYKKTAEKKYTNFRYIVETRIKSKSGRFSMQKKKHVKQIIFHTESKIREFDIGDNLLRLFINLDLIKFAF